jgi:hypothetical protein
VRSRRSSPAPRFRSWAFRGQGDARWPLYSSISRYLLEHRVDPGAWAEQEERILRIFRRKAHLYLAHVPAETDAFQWLALMQHHGAPTRLLDFTWSPFVAAFFALERATAPAAVWALCLPEIWKAKHKFPVGKALVTEDELGLRIPGNYERFFLGNEVPFVVTGEPLVMNQRLVPSRGPSWCPACWTARSRTSCPSTRARNAPSSSSCSDTAKVRDEAMFNFYNMNITNATLFPGLDGMARSLSYELEFHWAYDPKTMKRFPGY